MPESERLPIGPLSDPLLPRQDPVFAYLRERALDGQLPAHRAVIPLELIHPFDPEYRIQDLPIGRMVIELVLREWQIGKPPIACVYPCKGRFILPDDYIYYEAARIVKRPDLPCLVLGEAALPGVEKIQGPLRPSEVKRALDLL